MLKLFVDKNGNLNRNWKILVSKHGMPELNVDMSYSNDVRLKLAILGKTKLDNCPTCSKEVKIGSVYCSAKCASNDPAVKEKKINAIDTKSRSEKISQSLKGRNDYHQKTWESRKEKYGNTGFSKDGLEKIKSSDRNSDKAKKICIEKYGVDNASKSKEVKEKLKTIQLVNSSSRLHIPDWVFDKEQFVKIYN